jgi:hypothetical protein
MTEVVLRVRVDKSNPFYQAKLVLDADVDAERALLLNRATGKPVRHLMFDSHELLVTEPESNSPEPIESPELVERYQKTLYFRPRFALETQLMVILLDDTGEYNAAIADGVLCELVDINSPDTVAD